MFLITCWHELKDYFIKIKNKSQSNIIVAFDTWSLDYVKLRPKSKQVKLNLELKGGG